MNGFVYTKRAGGEQIQPQAQNNIQQPSTPQESTFGSNVGRILTGLAASGAAGLGAGASLGEMGLGLLGKGYEKITGQPSPLPERISIPYQYMGPAGETLQALTGALGYPSAALTPPTTQEIRGKIAEKFPEGYLEPQNIVESFGQSLAGGIAPSLALGGAPALIPLLSGTTAEHAAKYFGAGPGLQLAASLGGSLLIGPKTIPLRGSKLEKLADVQRNKLYSTAKQAQQGLKVNAENISNPLKELMETGIKTGVAAKGRKEVYKNLEEALNTLGFTKGETTLERARRAKEALNTEIRAAARPEGLYGDISPLNQQKMNAYKQAVGIINQEIQKAAEANPNFGVPYNKAEEITKAMRARDEIPSMLERLAGKKSFVIGPITLDLIRGEFGNIPKRIMQGIAAHTIYRGGKDVARSLGMYKKSPELRGILYEMGTAAAEANFPLFASKLSQLDSGVKQQEKQTEQQSGFVYTKRG